MTLAEFFAGVAKLKQSVEQGQEITELRNKLAIFLLDQYGKQATYLFYKEFNDVDLCEELCQDFYMLVLQYLHNLKAETELSLRKWLSVIARNLINRAFGQRACKKVNMGENFDIVDTRKASSPYLQAVYREIKQVVFRAMEEMPMKPVEKAILQAWLNGQNPQAIHEIVNDEGYDVSYVNVRAILSRIRKKIRNVLQKYYDEFDSGIWEI